MNYKNFTQGFEPDFYKVDIIIDSTLMGLDMFIPSLLKVKYFQLLAIRILIFKNDFGHSEFKFKIR